jgi:sugar fermentation stimulation protein A
MVEAGHRAVMVFLVQRTDCTHLSLAADLDPAYAAAFAEATRRGVETLAIGCTITPDAIVAERPMTLRIG